MRVDIETEVVVLAGADRGFYYYLDSNYGKNERTGGLEGGSWNHFT